VMDLATGHLLALRALQRTSGVHIWNFGTGRGQSVLEVVNAFTRVCDVDVPLAFEPRRAGDIAQCWADPSKALQELGWSAQRSLERMLADAWRWQCRLESEAQAAVIAEPALAPLLEAV
jgi:UDP-glucose 4-epimerase